MLLLKEFIKNPLHTGSITPSSPHLTRRVVDTAQCARASHVLELGPGAGALTGHILPCLGGEGQYLALEINPSFVTHLQHRFPGLNVRQSCAASFDFEAYTRRHGAFDVVISSLPWASFAAPLQRRILANVYDALAEGGVFVSFAYLGFHWLPSARSFHTLLGHTFEQVARTEPVLRNLPPAFVYACRK